MTNADSAFVKKVALSGKSTIVTAAIRPNPIVAAPNTVQIWLNHDTAGAEKQITDENPSPASDSMRSFQERHSVSDDVTQPTQEHGC